MQRRQLGTSGLEISTIGLGTWAVGGWMWGGQDDQASLEAIHAAVDHGVNWIDTAPIYGSGHAERIVGQALKVLPTGARPLVFTKFGLGTNSDDPRKSATREEVVRECEGSLHRLGIDQIDLYQLHWPAPQPIAETAAACQELFDAGKIRAIGVSNFSVEQLEEWQATGVPLHSVQSPFSILRPAVRATVLPWTATRHVGVLAYSPLLRGMLFGTWGPDKTFAPGDTRATHKDYSGPRFIRHLDAINEIRAVASTEGLTVPQLCVGVLLHTPGLTACIVGARDRRQGAEIAGLGMSITDSQAEAVWGIVGRLEADLRTIAG
ncbi:MAG: aldo/keto reductase [Vicinamibacterales bacterium]